MLTEPHDRGNSTPGSYSGSNGFKYRLNHIFVWLVVTTCSYSGSSGYKPAPEMGYPDLCRLLSGSSSVSSDKFRGWYLKLGYDHFVLHSLKLTIR
jgi:hypothetical protein